VEGRTSPPVPGCVGTAATGCPSRAQLGLKRQDAVRPPDCDKVSLTMKQTLGHVALVVRDYDEALAFFTRTLNFRVVEDTRWSEDKRWVLIAPPGSQGTSLLLARAVTPKQASRIGNQTGGRVFLFLHTDDFWRDYREMTARNVKFIREPQEEAYGTVAVFEDLYGNRWDLLQLKGSSTACSSKSDRAPRPA